MIPREVQQSAPMYYGKGAVSVYRTGFTPLTGLPAVPESAVIRRDIGLLAVSVDLTVSGRAFTPAYTEGDNSSVVATDSMKNFVLRHAAAYDGATLEGFLHFVGTRLLETYPQMERVHIAGRELPFAPVPAPASGVTAPASGVLGPGAADPEAELHHHVRLLRRIDDAYATAALELTAATANANRTDRFGHHSLPRTGVSLVALQSGLAGLRLVKLHGNSFAGFVRDEYTTLPDLSDRTLFTHVDLVWRYARPEDGLGRDPARYVAAFQVQDVVQAVCAAHGSRSIQELIHAVARRLLLRYPALEAVELTAENRTWDTVVDGGPGGIRVLTDPRPPYGILALHLSRSELS